MGAEVFVNTGPFIKGLGILWVLVSKRGRSALNRSPWNRRITLYSEEEVRGQN
jgi:hypothetical protein